MRKEFNDTGLCVPGRHYMVNSSQKIEHIIHLVERGKYFSINRPRQFGKTTTLSLLTRELNAREDYLALNLSFEDIDTEIYQHQTNFLYEFLMMLIERCEVFPLPEIVEFIEAQLQQITNMRALSRLLTQLIRQKLPRKKLVLLIDEIDKSSHNQLFLDFLAMLRKKYLQRNEGLDTTFQAVILAGVHDVKTLKAKMRPEQEKTYNSPWNIAVDFTVDLSFHPKEIETMLREYCDDNQIEMDMPAIAEQLHYYTSGYPYLVSKLCKFIDEAIVPQREDKDWSVDDVEAAFKMMTNEGYTTTLFDSLGKNLENNSDLYETVFQIVINGQRLKFSIIDPVINLGYLYGILAQSAEGWCDIHNRIFEQRIYGYMMSKALRTHYGGVHGLGGPDYYTDEGLDVPLILQRFQAFMKEHYSQKDQTCLEREGRLLFLSYLRPIITGKGFDFKEPNVAEERRMDIVITFRDTRYVLELKIWRGNKLHQEGLQQLSDYLDMYSLKQGCLLIYDFNKGKEYKQEQITFQDKHIFAVWV